MNFKSKFFACVFSAVIAALIAHHMKKPWAIFTTPNGGLISAEMQGSPTASKIGDGQMFESSTGSHQYIIGYTAIPEEARENASADELLDSVRDSSINDKKAVIVSEESKPLQGYKGRFIVYRSPDRTEVGFAHMCIAKNYLILTMAVTKSDSEVPSPEVERFLHSVKLNVTDE
jgi:hypothetical protein